MGGSLSKPGGCGDELTQYVVVTTWGFADWAGGGLGGDKVLRLSVRGGRRWLTLILAVSGLGA